MTTNDVLRSLRYSLSIKDSAMIEIFKLSDYEMTKSELLDLLKKEDEKGYITCTDKVMNLFLDGLIVHKRGRKEDAKPVQAKRSSSALKNNSILKKIRIALKLQEDDMLAILKSADMALSKSELSALFRREGHKHYKECGDQILRNFLKGLAIRYTNKKPPSS